MPKDRWEGSSQNDEGQAPGHFDMFEGLVDIKDVGTSESVLAGYLSAEDFVEPKGNAGDVLSATLRRALLDFLDAASEMDPEIGAKTERLAVIMAEREPATVTPRDAVCILRSTIALLRAHYRNGDRHRYQEILDELKLSFTRTAEAESVIRQPSSPMVQGLLELERSYGNFRTVFDRCAGLSLLDRAPDA